MQWETPPNEEKLKAEAAARDEKFASEHPEEAKQIKELEGKLDGLSKKEAKLQGKLDRLNHEREVLDEFNPYTKAAGEATKVVQEATKKEDEKKKKEENQNGSH